MDPNLDEDQATLEVLQSMESPLRMARRYLPSKHLIGPALYPTFVIATSIVLIILGVIYLVGVLVGAASIPADSLLREFGNSLLGLWTSALSSFAGLVLVFMLLDRYVLKEQEPAERVWDPKTIPEVHSSEIVRPFSSILKIVFALALIILIDFFPQWIGLNFYRDGQWNHVPAITDRFSRFVIPIHILAGLTVLFNLILIRRGIWEM